ncbi:MAG: SpoIID/LytB domain-containing protein [Clostridia bacterium]|nr:SpoIID/LytB domain-containing protein [Clostridia bacterium]
MMKRKIVRAAALLLIALLLAGCAAKGAENESTPKQATLEGESQSKKPALPKKLKLNENGVPELRVYQVDEEESRTLDIETYLQGVLAGEMKNDWPINALKAQAILARTFVLKFCAEKKSKYPNADISTDIEEAQAYDETGVNDRIEQAVKETEGLVLSYRRELPYAWFHAHSGGMTARAREGLNYEKDEPGYTQVVEGLESDDAPADAKEWRAAFSKAQVIAAAEKAGLSGVKTVDSIAVGDRGESGRAVTILINDQAVSAPELRLALGSSDMRSTLLTSLKIEDDRVVMAGKGYGHGVGMPQWGAYALAEDGKSAEEIVTYYFKDVTVEKVW